MMTSVTPRFYCWQRLILLCVLTLQGLSGCGKGSPAPAPTPPHLATPPNSVVFAYELKQLSPVGPYLPVLDEGRLRAAPPIEWYPAPRGNDYVVRFVRDRTQHSPLPRITVEACDSDWNQLGELSEENLKLFCEAVADHLDEKTRQAMDGDVKPLLLGSVPCAYFVINKQYRVEDKLIRGSCDVIKTLQHGRLYTLSLDVYLDRLIDYRADAFAVMAHMEFLVPEARGQKRGTKRPAASRVGTGIRVRGAKSKSPGNIRRG